MGKTFAAARLQLPIARNLDRNPFPDSLVRQERFALGSGDPLQRLDPSEPVLILPAVSVLQIKQSLSRLSAKEQREIQIYLHQLRRRTPAWKKATAKRIAEVQAGKFTTIEQLEELHRRG